jgi:hypothetical protein
VEHKFYLRKDLPKEDKDRVREIAKKRNAKLVEVSMLYATLFYSSLTGG